MKTTKTGFALMGAAIAALAASLCCILPVIAALAGLGGIAAVSASAVFASWRPYLLAASAALLAAGFVLAYRRPRRSCELDADCAQSRIRRSSRIALWIATVAVAALAAFPYYSVRAARAFYKRPDAAAATSGNFTAHAQLGVEGMDCPACAVALEHDLSGLPGVRCARVSYQAKQLEIDYDPRQVTQARFVQVVELDGYKVAAAKP